eukprot:TRINITY_DN2381_c0_g1_i2.p1 TRINITY_DN2381_c0_g1~~TRINITY_DN2381_c0_g1_i2.p1  ORF type:complete len:340 (-),score=43.63 TRINITY_DN2381_c0_g1_i2:8-1027(-)
MMCFFCCLCERYVPFSRIDDELEEDPDIIFFAWGKDISTLAHYILTGIMYFVVIIVSAATIQYVFMVDTCAFEKSECDIQWQFIFIFIGGCLLLTIISSCVSFCAYTCAGEHKTSKKFAIALVDGVIFTVYMCHIVFVFWISRTFIILILSLVIATNRTIQSLVLVITIYALFYEARSQLQSDFKTIKAKLINWEKLEAIGTWKRFFKLCRTLGLQFSTRFPIVMLSVVIALLVFATAYYAIDLSNRTIDDSVANLGTIFVTLILPALPKVTTFFIGTHSINRTILKKRLMREIERMEGEEIGLKTNKHERERASLYILNKNKKRSRSRNKENFPYEDI